MGLIENVNFFNLYSPFIKMIKELNCGQEVLPGHFYSPIPSIQEINTREEQIFNYKDKTILGIDLNDKMQLQLIDEFKEYYEEQPFSEIKSEGLRYYFDNTFFSYSDAIFLYCIIRHLKPRRIVEIGSGYSSAVMLDTNEIFFNNEINLTFIEPYPERILSILKESEKQKVNLIIHKVQDIPKETFLELEENDILFIDGSHVSKVGSDVNYIIFEILPKLKKGVHIHFHDIFYPFEYPKRWFELGKFWNEAYLLRAFLQYNNNFQIYFWCHYLSQFYAKKFIDRKMEMGIKRICGSIWLKKL